MIDPYTATKTAAIIAGLALNVLSYLQNVKDAPARSQQLRSQLHTVAQLAEYIEQLLKDKPQLPVASLQLALNEFRTILDELTHRVREASTTGARRFLWPFSEDETGKYLTDIEHYKTTFISFFVVHNVAMTYEIRDILKSQTPVPAADTASQTSNSLDISWDTDLRRPSSQYSSISRRTSNATQTALERKASYVQDYYDEFKRPPDPKLPQYKITALTPKDTRIYSLLETIDPKPTIQFVSLSASGRTAVLLSEYSFWVFETRYGTLICSRVHPKDKKKPKGFMRRSKEPQLPYHDRAFHCAALSDKLLAVGVNDMIMVFAIQEGSNTERPIFCDEFDCTNPERLQFSANGEQLVGVLRDTGEDRTQVLIYSTAAFPDPVEINWKDAYSPNDVTFSSDGNMIAICSSPSGSRAEIRILRKFMEEWREFLFQEEELFGKNDKVGLGFTRITFYQGNRRLAMSVDSPSVTDKDCFRIVADQRGKVIAEPPKNPYENIMLGQKGTDNWGIASSEYAVALVSKKGLLRIKHPNSNEWEILGKKDKNRNVSSPDHFDLLFSNTESRLLFIDREGMLEIYDFEDKSEGKDMKWKGIEFKLKDPSVLTDLYEIADLF